MKIAILSRRKNIYSTQRLVEAAEKRGHQADVINTLRCNMNITSSHPNIYYRGAVLDRYDAVVPRVGASITFYGAAVVRQFEMMGVFCLNDSVAI
ncbi:MAG TPA: 30S ribosomal protein S6--L-glutamate ligase, partial [Gammaproteobacteria bacterium]|nr:30S ribosomal protein S6--L-glutamate ligase [Gammaproteobacteria bacterium]